MKIGTKKRTKTVQEEVSILTIEFKGKTYEIMTLTPMSFFGLCIFIIFCFVYPAIMVIFIGTVIIFYFSFSLYYEHKEDKRNEEIIHGRTL